MMSTRADWFAAFGCAVFLLSAGLFSCNHAEPPTAEEQAEAEAQAASESEPLRSNMVKTMHLGEEPPERRSMAMILLVFEGGEGVSKTVSRSLEGTLNLSQQLAQQLAQAPSVRNFASLAQRYSAHTSARYQGVWGSFTRGILQPEFDEFLFNAEVGDISDPIQTELGVYLLQRIERQAACLTMMAAGTEAESLERCEAWAQRLANGEDFASLAKAESDDAATAARGGQLAIFERGSADALLKKAAFDASIGEVGGPIQSPYGYHLVKRVALDEVDPSYTDLTMVRARAILVQSIGAEKAQFGVGREVAEAEQLAKEIHGRIVAGEAFEQLAEEFNEDEDGKERLGDLGWLHRGTPQVSSVLDKAFRLQPDQLEEPFATRFGWLVLQRTQ